MIYSPRVTASLPWWAGQSLGCGPRGLTLDGHAVADLAALHGTPLYLYSAADVRRSFGELKAALATIGVPALVYYAVKANRFAPLLGVVRAEGDVGIDACSPREVALALESGFAPREISVTATMPSNRDLDAFVAHGVHVNLDSFSSLRRYAARAPRGTRVGLRLDAEIEAGYGDGPKVIYGNSKFGFAHADFDRAIDEARALGLVVSCLHVHCGWGLQAEALPKLEWLFARIAALTRKVPSAGVLNVGSGLCFKRRADDDPLGLEDWAAALRRHLAPLGRTIACEPGTRVVDRAGLLVVEVTTVEEKAGTAWVGVDAGHNVNVYAAHYGLPIEVVHVARPCAPAAGRYSVAGNINESNDVFATGWPLPDVREGDLLALLPAGSYGSSMASDHCLRGNAREVLL